MASDLSPAGEVQLHMRAAASNDAELVHRWANDPATRMASFTRRAIPLAEHLAWFARELARSDHHIYLAERRGEPVAFLRLEETPAHAGACTISINLAPEQRQRGLGIATLEAATGLARGHGFSSIRALVRPDNEASRRTFARAGYKLVGETDVEGESALLFVYELRA